MGTQIAQLYAKIGADTAGFEKGMKSSHTALASFSAALGTGLVAAAALGVAAIAGVGAVMVKGIKSAAELEQNVANIGATMGLSAVEMKPFEDLITNLALDPKLTVNIDEASSAVAMLAKMGVRGAEDMEKMSRATVLLSNSTGGDMATSAEVAMKAQKLWNISMEDTGRITNQTVGFLQNSTADLNDYRLAISAVGGVASSMNVSLEDTNAVLGISILKYGSAASAGDGYKTFLTSLSPATLEQAETMQRLGLYTGNTSEQIEKAGKEADRLRERIADLDPSTKGYSDKVNELNAELNAVTSSVERGHNAFYTSEGVLKSQAEIADLLAEKIGVLSSEEQTNAMRILFGRDAMRTAIAMMEARGKGIDEFKAKLANTDAEAAAAIRQATLTAQWALFSDTVAASVTVIGKLFIPAGLQVVEWLASMSAKHMPSIIEWFGKFAAWLTETLPKIEAFIEKLAGWAAAFINWATGSGKALDTVSTDAESMWTKVARVFGNLVAWVKDNLPIWVAQLQEWGVAAGAWIMETGWPLLVANLRKWGPNLWAWIKEHLPIWKENLREWGIAAGDWITDVGWPLLKKNMENWWIRLKEWTKEKLPYWIKELATWAVQLGAWAIDGISFLISTLADGMHEVKMWLRGTGQDGVKEGTGGYAAAFVKWIKEDAWPILKPALQGLIQSLVDLAGQSVGLIFDAAMAVGRAIVNGMIAGAKDVWRNATALWRDLPQNVIDTFNYMFGIHSPSKVFYDIGANVVQGFANGLVDTMPIVDRVMAGMSKTVTTVVAGMYDQINAATAEIALRASFAGIQAGEMANVHNDLITQNDANSTGLGANWTWADLNARDETLDVNRATQQGTTQQTSITIENVNLGGSGNSAQDILQAVNFINASYGYGY